jgi:hypothetical protein
MADIASLANLAATARGPVPFWDPFLEGYEGPVFLDPGKEPDACCWIGGYQLPGKAEITGSATQRIDVQKGNGRDGGVLIERGYVPGELDIDLTIWTPDQWVEWLRLLKIIFRPAGKLDVQDHKKKGAADEKQIEVTQKSARTFSQPRAQMIGINSVLIKQVALPRPAPDGGGRVITIKCVQYLPPTQASSIRRASGTAQTPPAQDPRQVFPTTNAPESPSEAGDGEPDGPSSASHAPI